MLRVKINGTEHHFSPESSILDAVRSLGIEIPTLCHDPRIEPYGGCRLCVVQIQGWARPVTACNTRVADGMEVETHSAEVEAHRRTILGLLARRYPPDAAERFPDKEFHRYLRAYGVQASGSNTRDPDLLDDSHPYIHVDMSQCVHCQRCVRICGELQGQFVWSVYGRDDNVRIRPDSNTTLRESSCIACGACVDACPSGALEDAFIHAHGPSTTWTTTTCPYCGVGCEMRVGVDADRIVTVVPRLDGPVNKGHLCVKGRYAHGYVHSGDRITTPMIRRGASWEPASWNEAMDYAAQNLASIIARHGTDSVGMLGSARATNEENFVAQKFARLVLGTHNVDCCARVCHAPTAAAMKLMLGTGASTNSFDDIEKAQTILVCGANPTENHPVVGARLQQAVRRGAKLIVVDPRRIELASCADFHLPLRPGTNVPLLNAMACTIVIEELMDVSFLRQRVSGWEEYLEFIRQWPAGRVAGMCGVDAELIRQAARCYAADKPALSIHGLGLTEHVQGTEAVMCLVNLALLTGNIGIEGSGINPLRGQNNVQGAAHMGCDPGLLTGGIALKEGREQFEKAWGADLPGTRGLNLLEMMDAAEQGKLKALWAMGYDVLLSNADTQTTRRALQSLELVIVQDLFLTETAREFGTIFFPAASSFEKDGTFMNAERRVQRVRRVIPPVGDSRSDWEILCGIASRMGQAGQFAYRSAEEIWEEIRSLWKAGSGITYARIEDAGLQWPCPSQEHPGTRILHDGGFPIGERAALRRIDYRPGSEQTDARYPFLLNTGRTLYHFNAGTMTLRTPNRELLDADYLRVAPPDFRRLGLQEGGWVRIRSRYGEVTLKSKMDSGVKPGELFATFHTPEALLNRVTGPHRDRFVKTPEYKVTAVSLESVPAPACRAERN